MKIFTKQNLIIFISMLILTFIVYLNLDVFKEKDLWDWLTLLIIPIFLTFFVLYFQHTQKKRETKQNEINLNKEYDIRKEQYLVENYKYFYDKMLEFLLLPDNERTDRLLIAIKVLVLSSFRKFDGIQKKEAIEFLLESDLLNKIALTDINLDDVTLKNKSLSNVNISNSNFNNFSLKSSLLLYSDLSRSFFIDSNLTGSNFQNCDFTNNKFDNTVLRGCVFQHKANRDIESNYILFNMYSVTYHKSDLRKTNFTSIFFNGGMFHTSDLTNSNFRYCKFENVTFNNCILDISNFINCKFINCAIKECSTQSIIFKTPDFTNSEFEFIDFSDTDLSSITINKNIRFTNTLHNEYTIWKNKKIPAGSNLSNMKHKIDKEIYKSLNLPFIEYDSVVSNQGKSDSIPKNKSIVKKDIIYSPNPIINEFSHKNDPIVLSEVEEIIRELKSIINFLHKNQHSKNQLENEGLNIGVFSELIKYRIENFNLFKIGFTSFPDLIKYITYKTEIKLVYKQPSEYRLISNTHKVKSFEDVKFITKLNDIHTVHFYKEILLKGLPIFKQFSKTIIFKVIDYIILNEIDFQNILFIEMINKLNNSLDIETEGIKGTIYTLINSNCFINEDKENKFMESKFSFISLNKEEILKQIEESLKTKLLNILEEIDDEIISNVIE